MKKGIAALLLATGFLVLLAGSCVSTSSAQILAKDDPVIYAQGSEARSLDPALIDDLASVRVVANLFDTLVRLKEGTDEIEPALAVSWSVSPNQKDWIFELRQGVKFHDGTPFNAEAVKYNVERQLASMSTGKMPYANFVYGMVDKVNVLDEYKIKFSLKYPYAPFLHNLAMVYSAAIVSPAAVRKYGEEFGQHPVGTGPYVFADWEKGSGISLVANSGYWGGKPLISKIVFQPVNDQKARLAMLLGGKVDIIDGVNAQENKQLKENPRFRLESTIGWSLSYLGLRVDQKPFNDLRVREALFRAINRTAIVKQAQEQAVLANQVLPPSILGYDNKLLPYSYDPEKARQLLTDAGCSGLTFNLLTYTGFRPYNGLDGEYLAHVIQEDLRAVGVTVKIITAPWPEYRKLVQEGQGEAFLYGWISDNGDPDNFLYALLHSSQIGNNGLNLVNYRNALYDNLISKAQKTGDCQERKRYYTRAQQILLKEVPWVFLSYPVETVAMREEIKGLKLEPNGLIYFKDVTP